MDAFGVKISDDRKRLPPTNDHRTRNVGGGRKNESKKCETHFFLYEEPHTVSNSFGVLDELITEGPIRKPQALLSKHENHRIYPI